MNTIKKRKSILIVEDEETHQRLYKYYIGNKYKVYTTNSVLGAHKQLEENDIDLAILDLSLHDSDGLNLIKELRMDNKWDGLIIVVISAHAFTSDIEICMAAGCNDYKTKPITQEMFLDTIQKYLK